MEPFNLLRPLVQVGIMDLKKADDSVIAVDFWKKQDKFIVDDLRKCKKTAWLLPDYQAQQFTRMLHQFGNHSDVGVNEYFKPNLNVYFIGAMPSLLIKKASSISSSGLLEWWSNLINRTDLVRRRENEPPVKPTMSGNIQIIFLFLAFGLTISQVFMIFELHGYIFRMFKASYNWCCGLVIFVVQKLKNCRSSKFF